MAAGRVDVSRRRGCDGYSNNYFDRYRNGAHGVEFNRGVEHGVVYKNGYHISSNARKFRIRRSGLSCRDEGRELGELQSGIGLDHSSGLEDGEIPKSDDGIQMPPEKKRKSSPIIWEIEDKVATKNRVLPTSPALSNVTSPQRAYCQGPNIVLDAGVAKHAFTVNQLLGLDCVSDKPCVIGGLVDTTGSEPKSPAILFPKIPEEKHKDGSQEQFEGEGEEFTEARNISMSRWASDSDSPKDESLSDDEGGPGENICRKEPSAERMKFHREALEGDGLRSSGSSERDWSSRGDVNFGSKLKNVDLLDADGIQDENGSFNQFDHGLGYVEESVASTQRGVNMLQGCRSVYEYEKLHEINEGTYGKVYKAIDKKTGKPVALKEVKMDVGGDRNLEEYGFPLSSLREINILLSFHHLSVVNVKEVVVDSHDNVFMVMEYMEHDLKGLMQTMKQPFSTSEIKCLMLQLLEGVKYLHDNWVLHRDLKTSNLLLNNQGELKICDFGMSRQYGSPLKPYTSLVVTLWYRAPELLLGAKQYSTAMDMWSVGCIMAELLAKEPLFRGKGEIDQLGKIFRILGTPSETIWPGFSKLPGAKANFVRQPYNLLRNKFPASSFTGSPVLSDLGFDLLNKLLTYDPEKRITADAALNHAWFHEVPLPKSKEFMPTFPPQHAKKR
uniref:cyclin-dependent kinase n=1 Tax=Hevea brasiliensis TaxID=3981 RepID=A0A0A6Z560_HEVBR|nr:CDK protein [Hevea brasiliensis]